VFFAVVQPVTGAACTDYPLELICLHPDQLIHTLIPTQASKSSLHHHHHHHHHHSIIIIITTLQSTATDPSNFCFAGQFFCTSIVDTFAS